MKLSDVSSYSSSDCALGGGEGEHYWDLLCVRKCIYLKKVPQDWNVTKFDALNWMIYATNYPPCGQWQERDEALDSSLAGLYMWQSRVEIEGYSVAYFDRIVAFEAPYRWASVKGGAHTHFVDVWISHESTKRIWAPPLTEAQQYGASEATMRSKYVTE